MEKSYYTVTLINKNTRIIFRLLNGLFIALIILSIYAKSQDIGFSKTMMLISAIGFFLTSLIKLIRSFVVVDYEKSGSITFKTNEILIKHGNHLDKFAISDLSETKILFEGRKDKIDSWTHSFKSYSGANNKITFKHGDKDHQYHFLVNNKKGEIWLHDYVDILIKSGYFLIFKNMDLSMKSRFNTRLRAANKVYKT